MHGFTLRTFRILPWLLLGTLLPDPAIAQEDTAVEGVVRSAETRRPLVGVEVVVLGTGRFVLTHGDGTFHLHGLPAGEYTLRVEHLGYAPIERTIRVPGPADLLTFELEESALQLDGLVVTGTVSERGADESLRPVSVLTAEELQRQLQPTVAATLKSEPGIAVTSMGPATARPVIRGMSGDRLLVLEDGNRVVDVSNTGSDHGTALDPTSARRIEVVRGPGAILYGSNALGGVINVIRDEIPSQLPHHTHGSVTVQAQSVNRGVGTAAHVQAPGFGNVAVRGEVAVRSSGDLATPAGDLVNTQVDSWNVGAGASLLGERGYFGASVLAYRNDYGIPGGFVGGHVEGVFIESERNAFKARAEHRPESGPFRSLRADASYSYYKHIEIEPPDIPGTLFERESVTGELLAHNGDWGPFTSGAIGARGSWESFGFGGSVFTPDSERLSGGIFAFQEIDLDPVRVEAGLRYDRIETTPIEADPDSDIGDIRDRDFGAWSGSLGMLVDVGAGFLLGANVSRAFRTPDVNELYSEGPHLAAYSFEVGNPSLAKEVGTGFDVFARMHSERGHVEATAFLNDITGFVYGRETGELSRTRLPIYQFFGEDARFVGVEGAVEWVLSGPLKLDASAAYVRGTIDETGEPLPLIPPLQLRGAIAYEPTDWFVRAEVESADAQDRVGEFERPTEGYTVFGVSGGIRRTFGGRLNVLTLTLENLTDEEYRNHLSRVKEIMPEAGRGITLTYRVVF